MPSLASETFTAFVQGAPRAAQVQSGDLVPVVQGGMTKQIPAVQLVGAASPTLIQEGSTYPVTSTDTFIGVANTVATTIQLPTGLTFNQRLVVADCLGNAGTYAITILPGAGDNIDGISQFRLIDNWQSASLQYIQALNLWKLF
jgi:hypothetical protein